MESCADYSLKRVTGKAKTRFQLVEILAEDCASCPKCGGGRNDAVKLGVDPGVAFTFSQEDGERFEGLNHEAERVGVEGEEHLRLR